MAHPTRGAYWQETGGLSTPTFAPALIYKNKTARGTQAAFQSRVHRGIYLGCAPRQPLSTFLLLDLQTSKKFPTSDVYVDNEFSLVSCDAVTGNCRWHMGKFDDNSKLDDHENRVDTRKVFIYEAASKYYTSPAVLPSLRLKVAPSPLTPPSPQTFSESKPIHVVNLKGQPDNARLSFDLNNPKKPMTKSYDRYEPTSTPER